MPSLPEKKFSFTSKAMPEDTFAVVSFTGFEAISHIYEFDIRLVTDDPDVSLEDVLNNPVKFTIHRDDDTDVDFNGILASFEELN
jgi:type VI secretion system secreted protein VgrG